MRGEERRRARLPTRGAAPTSTVAGMASGVTVTNTVETLFLRLNDFLPEFDQLKLKFSYGNMKFGQNKSYRKKEDLQLSFWAEVDLELGLRTKTRSNIAKTMFNEKLG